MKIEIIHLKIKTKLLKIKIKLLMTNMGNKLSKIIKNIPT